VRPGEDVWRGALASPNSLRAAAGANCVLLAVFAIRPGAKLPTKKGGKQKESIIIIDAFFGKGTSSVL